MKRLIPLALAAVLLCGCKDNKTQPPNEPIVGTTPGATTTVTPIPQEPEPDPIPDNTMSDALINNDRICVKIGEQWGFIDKEGNIIIEPLLDNPGKFNAGLLPVNDNGLYGYLDPDGEWAIEPQFMYATPFSEGVATIAMLDENRGGPAYSFINHTGRTITTFRDGAGRGWPFYKGAAIVGWSNQKYAVVSKTGDMVFETQFEQFQGNETTHQFIFDGLIGVRSDGKWGFIDSAGEWIIKAQYEAVDHFENRLCSVKIDGKWGVIDTTGKVIIEPKYDWYVRFSNDLAAVNIDGKYGYINKEGKVAIKAQYVYAMDFVDGVAWVVTEQGHGLIDTNGNWVLKPIYKQSNQFSQGLAPIQIDDTNWGYVDKTGTIITQGYRWATPFYEDGYAVVMTQEGKFAVIDKTGAQLFDATFDGIGNYTGTIDENGRLNTSTLGR